jgi:hypothetical protein
LAVRIITPSLLVYEDSVRVSSDNQLTLSLLEVILRYFKIELKKRISQCIFQSKKCSPEPGLSEYVQL